MCVFFYENTFKNIIARVNQLMALCDELESKLNQSHIDGAKLMRTVVAGSISHYENMLKYHIFQQFHQITIQLVIFPF